MTRTLLVIRDPAGEAAANMAADLALLRTAVTECCVCLRLYSWARPTVSLGFMQRPEETLDLAALERDHACWVRRPTGGRAVLHDSDLTYCVAFPLGMPGMGGSIQASYRVIGACLAEGLRLAGIETDAHASTLDAALVRREGKLPCFLAPNREEVMAGGRKLVGSAQKRSSKGVLQHGSMPLTPAFRRLPEYLKLSEERRVAYERLFESKCVCVEELRSGVTGERLAACLEDGFRQTLS